MVLLRGTGPWWGRASREDSGLAMSRTGANHRPSSCREVDRYYMDRTSISVQGARHDSQSSKQPTTSVLPSPSLASQAQPRRLWPGTAEAQRWRLSLRSLLHSSHLISLSLSLSRPSPPLRSMAEPGLAAPLLLCLCISVAIGALHSFFNTHLSPLFAAEVVREDGRTARAIRAWRGPCASDG